MRQFSFLLLLVLISTFSVAQPPELSYNHYALQVSNLDKSAKFYSRILGLQEIENKTEQPHIRWFSTGARSELHIIESDTAKEAPGKGVHLALTTQNLDGVMAHLRSANTVFENWMGEKDTTNTRPDGIRQIYLQDPDGYWIEINGK